MHLMLSLVMESETILEEVVLLNPLHEFLYWYLKGLVLNMHKGLWIQKL